MIVVLLILMLFCAVQTIHTSHLLHAVLWLASSSVVTSILLYTVGAHEIAVIELSVGAGLTMVLLVFAITVVGESTQQIDKPHWGYLVMVMVIAIGFIVLTAPELSSQPAPDSQHFTETMWHERALDVVLQIALLFGGALTVLALLMQPVKEEDQVKEREVEEEILSQMSETIARVNATLEEELV